MSRPDRSLASVRAPATLDDRNTRAVAAIARNAAEIILNDAPRSCRRRSSSPPSPDEGTAEPAAARSESAAEEPDGRFVGTASLAGGRAAKGCSRAHTCSVAIAVVGPKRFGLADPAPPRCTAPWRRLRLRRRRRRRRPPPRHGGGGGTTKCFNNSANNGGGQKLRCVPPKRVCVHI